jgi:ABC-type uncharacterized transport system substrate-binding protein
VRQRFLFLTVLLTGMSAYGQDMTQYIRLQLINEMVPNSAKFGFIYTGAQDDFESELAIATNRMGIVAVKAPISSIRDVAQAIRFLIAKHKVDFIWLEESSVVTSKSTMKFVVKQAVKKGVPVFTTASDAFDSGALGRLEGSGEDWTVKLNGKVLDLFQVQIPQGNDKYVIEE